MPWTHEIQDTVPRADNLLNLETTVKWTNSDTGEVLFTKPFATDINKSIKTHLRAIMDNVLPARDAAILEMKALKGTSVVLTLTPDEQVAKNKAAEEQAKFLAQAKLQQETILVTLKVRDEADKAYTDALQAAKDAILS